MPVLASTLEILETDTRVTQLEWVGHVLSNPDSVATSRIPGILFLLKGMKL